MSDDLIERLNAATEGTTPGPWWTNAKYNGQEMGCAIIAARTDSGPLPGNPTRGMVAWSSAILNTDARRCEANARFIAAARQLVPEAAAALAAQRAEIERLREALRRVKYWLDTDGQEAVDLIAAQQAEIAALKSRREVEDMALARAAYRAGQEDAAREVVAHDPRVILSLARAALTGKENGDD